MYCNKASNTSLLNRTVFKKKSISFYIKKNKKCKNVQFYLLLSFQFKNKHPIIYITIKR